jgi:hypothetical protein
MDQVNSSRLGARSGRPKSGWRCPGGPALPGPDLLRSWHVGQPIGPNDRGPARRGRRRPPVLGDRAPAVRARPPVRQKEMGLSEVTEPFGERFEPH